MACIHGEEDCIRCFMEDLPEPVHVEVIQGSVRTPFEIWEAAVKATGAGWENEVEGISSWHDGCPTGCLPCNCKPEDIWLNKGKSHSYGVKETCIFCWHSKVYIHYFSVYPCRGHRLSESRALSSLSGIEDPKSEPEPHTLFSHLKDMLTQARDFILMRDRWEKPSKIKRSWW